MKKVFVHLNKTDISVDEFDQAFQELFDSRLMYLEEKFDQDWNWVSSNSFFCGVFTYILNFSRSIALNISHVGDGVGGKFGGWGGKIANLHAYLQHSILVV